MKTTDISLTAIDTSQIWRVIGDHGARLTIAETNNIQHKQDIVNIRAEVTGIVAEHRVETHDYIHRIEQKMEAAEAKMEAIWDSIAIKLGTLQKFQWTILIGGGVIATMVSALIIISWQILTNHDKLNWIWAK